MRTHYFRKITTAIGNGIKNFYSKINFPSLYRTFFILGYVLVCTFILLPRIDYQEWYPDNLARFDYEPSQDFRSYKKLEITVSDTKQIPNTIEIINDRLFELGVYGYRKSIDGDKLILDLPYSLSERIIDLSVGSGEAYLNKRTEESSTDYSPEVIYNPSSYETSTLDLTEIKDSRIIEIGEGYTSIEITTDKEEDWNALAGQVAGSSLGLFVDGNLYLAQIVPTGDSIPKPRLVIFSEEQEVSLISSQLRNERLDSIYGYGVTQEPPVYSSDYGSVISIMVLLSIVVGLVYRYFYDKDSNRNISQSILIVVGILTISKIIPITWGILELTILSIMILLILTNRMNKALGIGIFLSVTGILIDQFIGNSLHGIGKLVYASGIYSSIMYLILFLTGIYEEN